MKMRYMKLHADEINLIKQPKFFDNGLLKPKEIRQIYVQINPGNQGNIPIRRKNKNERNMVGL